MQDKILVIIVTYNGMEWMERCITSVCSSSVPADIFVIDNGSTDGTQDYLMNCGKEIMFIQSEENLGFGRANNKGLEYAAKNGYDYVYLLNQDAWVEKDTFEILIRTHKKHPEFGILSPVQIEANGMHMDKNFLNSVALKSIESNFTEDQYFGTEREIYTSKDVMAAHWLISRDCLLRTGGFSPAFRHYGEDNNYIDRAEYHRFKAGFVPATRAVHDRESRRNTLDCPARRINIITLIELSDITKDISWFRIIAKYIQYTYKYCMIRHFKELFRNIFRLKETLAYRKKSYMEGAFLDL